MFPKHHCYVTLIVPKHQTGGPVTSTSTDLSTNLNWVYSEIFPDFLTSHFIQNNQSDTQSSDFSLTKVSAKKKKNDYIACYFLCFTFRKFLLISIFIIWNYLGITKIIQYSKYPFCLILLELPVQSMAEYSRIFQSLGIFWQGLGYYPLLQIFRDSKVSH